MIQYRLIVIFTCRNFEIGVVTVWSDMVEQNIKWKWEWGEWEISAVDRCSVVRAEVINLTNLCGNYKPVELATMPSAGASRRD